MTNYTYIAANQITNSGFTYDNNGKLTSDGTNTHVWDRANRLLSMGSSSYAYDGVGNRVKQTIGANVTQYLLDLQPGVSVVLAETQGANTTRYVQGPTGIHAHKDSANNWEWTVQDGLGSVRGVVDNTVGVLESRVYEPYGVSFGVAGTSQTTYGFTGEPTDTNGLVHLRTRYYAPNLSVFTVRDPFEGLSDDPMSLNGYNYAHGNPIVLTDPSGENPLAIAVGIGFLALGVLLLLDRLNQLSGNESFIEAGAEALERTWNNLCVPVIEAVANLADEAFTNGFPTITGADPASQIWRAQNAEATRRREIARRDEAAMRRDAKNPFDMAFGLSNYSGVFPGLWGDLEAFALSFRERRTYPFFNWPDWLIRSDDGINIYQMPTMGVNVFLGVLPAIINYYLSTMPEGKIKFNLSGMDNRPANEESITRLELDLMLREYRTSTRFYSFDPVTQTRTELVEPALSVRLSEILTTSP